MLKWYIYRIPPLFYKTHWPPLNYTANKGDEYSLGMLFKYIWGEGGAISPTNKGGECLFKKIEGEYASFEHNSGEVTAIFPNIYIHPW